MPFALASPANSPFQASKPAAVLPHCAASAFVLRHASTAAKTAVVSSLLPIIPTLLSRRKRSPDAAQRNPGFFIFDSEIPDCAEPVIGRAFARPVGFIRATTFARSDLPSTKHRLPPLIEREHAFAAIFGSDQAIVSLDLERQPIPHRHLQAAMNGLL